MQYSFSYFYYLINEQPEISDELLFEFSDVDNNGYILLLHIRLILNINILLF